MKENLTALCPERRQPAEGVKMAGILKQSTVVTEGIACPETRPHLPSPSPPPLQQRKLMSLHSVLIHHVINYAPSCKQILKAIVGNNCPEKYVLPPSLPFSIYLFLLVDNGRKVVVGETVSLLPYEVPTELKQNQLSKLGQLFIKY